MGLGKRAGARKAWSDQMSLCVVINQLITNAILLNYMCGYARLMTGIFCFFFAMVVAS